MTINHDYNHHNYTILDVTTAIHCWLLALDLAVRMFSSSCMTWGAAGCGGPCCGLPGMTMGWPWDDHGMTMGYGMTVGWPWDEPSNQHQTSHWRFCREPHAVPSLVYETDADRNGSVVCSMIEHDPWFHTKCLEVIQTYITATKCNKNGASLKTCGLLFSWRTWIHHCNMT